MGFKWGLFSPKALQSIDESTARLNIWTGAVRSGKTISSIVRWLAYVREAPPGDLLMVGKTERTLKRNILDPLQQMVGASNFDHRIGAGELRLLGRRIYLAGANDERSTGKIQGATVAGAYGDELTLWPESFFKMLLSRASVEGAQIFGTTNPDNPYHWLKKDFLDRAAQIGLRHWHFVLTDNPNLGADYIAALTREYTGLWHKRYIQGLWVAAEGAVYDMFDHDQHVVDDLPQMTDHWVGIDYGTTNATVYLLVGLGADDRLYVVREWRWDSERKGRQMTDAQYSQALKEWLAQVNIAPRWIFIDPSAASFIRQLHQDRVRGITQADNAVLDGIRTVSSLLSSGRLLVHKSCTGLIEELSGYSWDSKAQARGEDKPLKRADHGPDALRYAVNGIPNVTRRLLAL